MREIINEAIKQLNNEGLLEGTKITQQGKGTAESIIRDNEEIKDKIFKFFWLKIQNDFYETSPKEFCLRLLKIQKIFKNLNLDLFEKIQNFSKF